MPLYDEDKEQKKLAIKDRDRRRREKMAADDGLRQAIATYEGRQFIWRILELSRAVGHNAFAATPEATAFNCGQQNVGQQILAQLLEIAPDAYIQMIKENFDGPRSDTAGTGTSDDASGDTTDYT